MLTNEDPLGQEGGTPIAGGCGWLIEVPTNNPEPDFPSDMWREEECGAPAFETDRGWYCEQGHSYVDMMHRHQEGWDYSD